MKHTYEVIVGNIGQVHQGENALAATAIYFEYVDQSLTNIGRASREDVTLMRDGEPWREFTNTQGEEI